MTFTYSILYFIMLFPILDLNKYVNLAVSKLSSSPVLSYNQPRSPKSFKNEGYSNVRGEL
jgi:hypothetical protein